MLLLTFGVLFGCGYIVAPALAVYSWLRWSRSRRRRSRGVRVSLVALALASAALLLGVAVVGWSSVRHGVFLYLAPLHSRLYLAGVVLSAAAVLTALVGTLWSNPLRVKSLLVSLGCASFWFLAGSGQ